MKLKKVILILVACFIFSCEAQKPDEIPGSLNNLAEPEEHQVESETVVPKNIIDQSDLPKVGIVLTDNLRIRKSPDLDGDIIGMVSVGDEFTVLDKTEDFYEIGQEQGFWYLVKTKDTEGWLYGAYVAFEHKVQNNKIYGIKISSINYNNTMFELGSNKYFLFIQYSLIVYSLDTKQVIQEIKGVDYGHSFYEIQFVQSMLEAEEQAIELSSKFNGFTTGPIEFVYSSFYTLGSDGRVGAKQFEMIEKAGMQDFPNVTLREFNQTDEKIHLVYDYDYSIYPVSETGPLQLLYVVNPDGIEFETIESELTEVSPFENENGEYEFIERKSDRILTTAILDEQFNWCKVPFVFAE